MSGRHDRPPPNGGHTFTKFDSYRAILFGGSLELDRTANTMYIFDLEKKVIDILAFLSFTLGISVNKDQHCIDIAFCCFLKGV